MKRFLIKAGVLIGVFIAGVILFSNILNRKETANTKGMEYPTLVMLALAFLVMIGLVLIADGLGFHVPKGYIYAAMAFSTLVEVLNMLSRRSKKRGAGG